MTSLREAIEEADERGDPIHEKPLYTPWNPGAGTPIASRWVYVFLLALLLMVWGVFAVLVVHLVRAVPPYAEANPDAFEGRSPVGQAVGFLLWLPIMLGIATWWTLKQLFASQTLPPSTP